MKCCKCKAEIPDQSKFCMVCGEKQPTIKTCANCGTTGLPEYSKFCPHCGQELNDPQEMQSYASMSPSVSKQTIQTGNNDSEANTIPKDARELFFPLNGLMLGKTTIADAKRKGLEIDNMFGDEETFSWPLDGTVMGIHCSKKTHETFVDHIFISGHYDYPEEWKQRHKVSFETPYNLWMAFLKQKGFSVKTTHHDTGFLQNTDSVNALSADGNLSISLLFKSNDHSLGTINIDYYEFE